VNVQPFPRKRAWLARCIVSASGGPLPILHNAVEALRGDPAIKDAYAFDEMLRIPMLMHAIGVPLDSFDPRPVSDSDVTELQRWMQAAGVVHIARETVRDALSFRAAELAYHPIREYLENAQWDGQPRVNIWLYNQARRRNDAIHPGCRPHVSRCDGCPYFRARMQG
jgi:hypothetical protein